MRGKLNQGAVDRVMCLAPVHLLVACQSIVARLRRVHEALRKEQGDRAALQAAHEESCEALLNLLAVLDADGSHRDAVAQCRAGLQHALSAASAWKQG